MKKFIIAIASISAFACIAAEQSFDIIFNKSLNEYNNKKYAESLNDIESALKLAKTDDDKITALTYKFYNYNAQRKYAEAAVVFDEILKMPKLSDYRAAWVLCQQAVAYYNAGKLDECIASCDKLIALPVPDYADQGYHYKYSSLNRQKNYDKALETANKFADEAAKMKNPMFFRAKLNQISALSAMKEYDKALVLVSDAELKNFPGPQLAEYYNLIGSILSIQKKYQEAIASYEKAAASDFAYTGGAALYSIGDMYVNMKKDDEAVAAYSKVLESNGAGAYHKSAAVFNVAKILERQGKKDEALKMIENFDQINAPNPNLFANAKSMEAKILLEQDKKEDAKKVLNSIILFKGMSDAFVKQAKAELDKIK